MHTMSPGENPLLQLSAEKQRQLVEVVENNDIDSIAAQTGLTRRQVMGIGVALAGSAATGGVAANEVIGNA